MPKNSKISEPVPEAQITLCSIAPAPKKEFVQNRSDASACESKKGAANYVLAIRFVKIKKLNGRQKLTSQNNNHARAPKINDNVRKRNVDAVQPMNFAPRAANVRYL